MIPLVIPADGWIWTVDAQVSLSIAAPDADDSIVCGIEVGGSCNIQHQ